jgi:uncharacterized membrane protein YbhN (UPF0104 family)
VPTGALAIVVRIGMQEREGVAKRVGTLGLLYEIAIALAAAGLLCLSWSRVPRCRWRWACWRCPRSPSPWCSALERSRRWPTGCSHGSSDSRVAFLPTAVVLRLTLVMAISFVLAGVSVLCVVRGLTDAPAGSTPTIVASAALGFITSFLGFALPGGLGAREAGLTARCDRAPRPDRLRGGGGLAARADRRRAHVRRPGDARRSPARAERPGPKQAG